MLAAFVAVTTASLVFNAVTTPPPRTEPGFGQYLAVGSSQVHYERWGDHGTPVVFVPGFLESSTVWSDVGRLLAADHRVYAVDLPGDGYTRYTGPMTLAGQAEMLDGFVRALGLQRPLVVGHSLGAAVAGSVALRHPHDVGAVVFADGDGLPIGVGPRWLRGALLDSPYATTALRVSERWTWPARQLIKATCGPECPTVSDALVRQWVGPLRQVSGERALHALMLNADYGLTAGQISAISVPTAVIWGSGDQEGGSLDATITNLHHPPVHVIQAAGHLTMLANPVAFARDVESAENRR